jgi:invasion protein IalB
LNASAIALEIAMNWKNLSIATLFAALSLGALSAQAQNIPTPETYKYGTHLDIKKVLSSKEGTTPACSVVTSQLTYLDSTDQVHVLDYQSLSGGCHDN